MTARLTDKGKALALGGGTLAPVAAAPATQRRPARAVIADPGAIVWEDPPPSSGGRTSQHWFIPFVEKLKARPGVWARVLICGDRAATRCNSVRGYAKANKLPIEVSSRSGAVYARFVGKK